MLYHMRGAANAIKTAGGILLFVICLAVCWILLRLDIVELEPREEAGAESIEDKTGD